MGDLHGRGVGVSKKATFNRTGYGIYIFGNEPFNHSGYGISAFGIVDTGITIIR